MRPVSTHHTALMIHLKLILLVTSFVLPFALSIILFRNSGEYLSKKVMAFALLNTSLVFLFNYFYFQKEFQVYASVHSLHIGTVLWIFPSIYLYIKSIVLNEEQFRKELLHLLPGAVFMIISAVLFYGFLNYQERIYYLTTYRTGIEFTSLNLKVLYVFRYVDVALIVLQVFYYTIRIFNLPKCFFEQLQAKFSDNNGTFSVNFIKGFNLSFVVIGLLFVLFYIFNPFKASNEVLLVCILFFVSAFIWMMGLFAFKQHRIIENEPGSVPLHVDVNELEVSKTDDQLMTKLIEYIEENEVFLQHDLSLTMVCQALGTNRTYLSTLINQELGINFCRFINNYRIDYIKGYQKEHPQATNEELARIGGFGSISSMKRAMNK